MAQRGGGEVGRVAAKPAADIDPNISVVNASALIADSRAVARPEAVVVALGRVLPLKKKLLVSQIGK